MTKRAPRTVALTVFGVLARDPPCLGGMISCVCVSNDRVREQSLRLPAWLSALETQVVQRFVSEVRAHFGTRVEGLVLFGSRARQEGHEESDVDVFVLVDAVTRAERQWTIDVAWTI